jgi:hypothetical protein
MIKKFLKKVSFVLILILLLGIFGFVSARIWLGYRFNSKISYLRYKEFFEDIRNAESMPKELYDAYSRVHPYDQNTSTNELLLKTALRLFNDKFTETNCPCVEVNHPFVTRFLDRLAVGIQLDKDAGTIKCLDYYLAHFDFLYGQIGIRNASKFYYKKPLESLEENELIELCIMTISAYYNKEKNPDKLKEKLSEIINTQ